MSAYRRLRHAEGITLLRGHVTTNGLPNTYPRPVHGDITEHALNSVDIWYCKYALQRVHLQVEQLVFEGRFPVFKVVLVCIYAHRRPVHGDITEHALTSVDIWYCKYALQRVHLQVEQLVFEGRFPVFKVVLVCIYAHRFMLSTQLLYQWLHLHQSFRHQIDVD